jgi:Domain of unknown function (DUF4157)
MAAVAAPKAKSAKPGPKKPVVQAKLHVGSANDRLEHEADRVAQRVGSAVPDAPPPMISGLAGVQRAALPAMPGPERRREDTAKAPEARAQRDVAPKGEAVVGVEGGEVPPQVEASIAALQRRPAPGLDPAVRQRVESAVGSDLSGVRVHNDGAAAHAADALGARAFTVGRDMVFGRGQYDPGSSGGQKLIAHEAAHTVQQTGGSSRALRVQRKKGGNKPTTTPTTPLTKVKKFEGSDWAIDVTPTKEAPKGGVLKVPRLELPSIVGALKGSANPAIGPASETGVLPIENQPFNRHPRAPRDLREDGAAYQKWVAHMQTTASKGLQTLLVAQLKAQSNAAPISNAAGQDVYVLKRKNLTSDNLDTLLIGTPEELARHDGLLRPMLSRSGQGKGGAAAEFDADHILEDQLGGLDSPTNMWLLDRSYNRSVGSTIKARIDKTINETLVKAKAEEEKQLALGFELDGKIPGDVQAVKQQWTINFANVTEGKFGDAPNNYWTRDDITKGIHLKHFAALTELELAKQGFKYDPNQKPTRINVYPARDGGRAIAFKVSDDGKSLKRPGYFFKGIDVTGDPVYDADALKDNDTVLFKLPVAYTKKKDRGKEDSPLIRATGEVTVKHDKQLGFGGYVTRDSITGMFKDSDFKPLSPMAFPDVSISPEGELTAAGQIAATKNLFPSLQVPLFLRGTDVLLSFPVPSDKLSFGPVSVVDAAIDLGVGDNGFFMQGSAGIVVKDIGQGTIVARAEKDDVIIAGDFNLDMDFLDPAKIAMTYSLAKDDFVATATLGLKEGALPGVTAGQVEVTISRASIKVFGTLSLGGVLSGSTITVGYAPETGLAIEGKDIPLPVGKLPGVSEASLTVKAVRNPETRTWVISGGGKAKLAAGGANGSLDILYDGDAVSFTGRVEVAKGPATGWLQITGTNRAIDDEGKPIDRGPVGEMHIWGKGEASVAFGKVLTGTAGIEYTPDGRTILSGEIALPPTYDLFPKKDLSPKEPLFSVSPPDFPIWGVKVGPVGFGIFAFVDASIRAEAFVGPGQLKNAKLNATLDLDKPEEAQISGEAMFFVPSYAGLTLDVGGGVKAQVAVAFVKGRVGLYGKLGIGVDGSFGVDIHWNQADGLAVGALAKIVARPKFEIGVNASITAGVDIGITTLDKTWGPWEKALGSFGPDMELSASFPMKWSEKDGLDLDADKIVIERPSLDAKEIMNGAFDMLV